MKNSGIGGQAVIEGVMMKNGNKYAVAVRKPDGSIAVEIKECKDSSKRSKFLQLPLVRGVIAFIDSLTIGMDALTIASKYYVEDEEETKFEKKLNEITKGKGDKIINGLTICFSIVLACVIFIIVPLLLSRLIEKVVTNQVLLGLIEGIIRVLIFILYIFLISRIRDIKRLFMYHGAEHKCISCIESGKELTVKNVRASSKEHKRCGTSFILNVMILSIIFFMVVRVDNVALKLVLRLLLIPVIAGISYEFTKLAGKSDSKIVNILSKPGLLMQKLTTKEPDDKMIEVGIKSVEAVFDWREFLGIDGSSEKKHGKKDKKHKHNNAEEETVAPVVEKVAEEAQPVEEKKEEPEQAEKTEKKVEKPLEVDISKLFDIKIPDVDETKPKKGWKVKHEEEPRFAAPETSAEEDEILAALDFMFEYNGPKTQVEITDDPNAVSPEQHKTDSEGEETDKEK